MSIPKGAVLNLQGSKFEDLNQCINFLKRKYRKI